MSVKLLTEHHLEFLSLKQAAQDRLSLHLSKCHIVGNHMPWLKYATRYFGTYRIDEQRQLRRANAQSYQRFRC